MRIRRVGKDNKANKYCYNNKNNNEVATTCTHMEIGSKKPVSVFMLTRSITHTNKCHGSGGSEMYHGKAAKNNYNATTNNK